MNFFPDWNSVESTARWSDILFWTGIVCLLLLAVSEITARIYSNRSAYLSGEKARVEEDKSQKQRAEDQARFDAEKSQLNQQLMDAKGAADEAKRDAAELKRIREPRHLSESQKSKIESFLRGKTKGNLNIKASISATDARPYAEEIGALLKDRLGWAVRIDNALIAGGDVSNIWITVRNPEALPPGTDVLFEALKRADVPMHETAHYDPNGPALGEIWLSIGSKQ